MSARLQHDRAGRFILGVQGVQAHETACQIQSGQQFLLGHRNFIGLFRH